MRHDPASAAIVIMLRELKMHGMAHAVARAVRPRVGAHLPGGPVAGDAILLVGLDIGVAHALEVVVRGIELPHVVKAEQIIFAFVTATPGGAVAPRSRAASPLAGRRLLARSLLVVLPDADAVEIFRVELHCFPSMCASRRMGKIGVARTD